MQHNQLDSQNVTTELLETLLKDRRSERRWKNIRFFLGLLFAVFIIFNLFKETNPTLSEDEGKDYVALIRLDGMIAPGENFSAKDVLPLLKEAFKDKNAKGIILDINSGGGTPVQAAIIHDAIIDLKNKYHKKV